MTATESYHHFLCRERAACEGDFCCMQDPKVVRNVDGQARVYCYEHDPENGQAEWHDELERRNQHDELLRKPSPDERDEFERNWRE